MYTHISHTYKCVQLTMKDKVVLNLRGSGGGHRRSWRWERRGRDDVGTIITGNRIVH